jgi:hypothetical protein
MISYSKIARTCPPTLLRHFPELREVQKPRQNIPSFMAYTRGLYDLVPRQFLVFCI